MRVPLFFFVLPFALAGACSNPTPLAAGVPLVPDAVVDIAFPDLGTLTLVAQRLAGAGWLPEGLPLVSQSGLEAAGVGAPVVVAVRASGDIVFAGRLLDPVHFQLALAAMLPPTFHSERRFGHVDAVVDAAGTVAALVRAQNGVVVVVIAPVDPWGAATLLEAMGSGSWPAHRRSPTAIEVNTGASLRSHLPGLDALSGTLKIDGPALRLSLQAHSSGGLEELIGSLSSSSPSFSCAVEQGAALALRLPPVGVAAVAGLVDADSNPMDSFEGRVVLALHEVPAGTPLVEGDKATWASIVVAGRPRVGGAAALRQTLAAVGPAPVWRRVGARQVQDLLVADKPWRQVSAVVDDDIFALAVGAPVVVDAVAVGSVCADVPGRVLFVDGARLLRIVSRAAPEVALLRSLGVDGASMPIVVRALAGVQELEVSALARGNTLIDLDLTVVLAPALRR